MKKQNIFFTFFLAMMLAMSAANAQEYKLDLSSGTITFYEVHKLTIEGTSGNEVIFTSEGGKSIPERAQGLRPVNSQGLLDNTGIGLAVKKVDNNTYEISDVLRNSGRYVVKIPKGVRVMIEQNSVHGSKIEVKDLPNDLEISSRHSAINLTNISGSALINSVHGDVNAVFSSITPGKPISIVSAHGPVDVTLPASAKATIKLSSKYGDIFTDPNIKYDVASGEMRQITSEVTGQLNGGGTEVFLESRHSNIYLRTK